MQAITRFALALLLLAGLASAATLADQVDALEVNFEALRVDIANCPDGSCQGAQGLVDEHDALSAERVYLVGEVGSNQTLLDKLADIKDIEDETRSILGEWDLD